MGTFADRLRQEIAYQDLTRKELAERSQVKLRALDMYLGSQGSMPSADAAVRIAKALNVTVEYLVTGEKETHPSSNEIQKQQLYWDLKKCSENTRNFLETAVHLFAEYEKKQNQT